MPTRKIHFHKAKQKCQDERRSFCEVACMPWRLLRHGNKTSKSKHTPPLHGTRGDYWLLRWNELWYTTGPSHLPTNHAPKSPKSPLNPTCTWHRHSLYLLRCWIGWRFRLRISCGFGFFLHRWRNRRSSRCHGCPLRRQVLRHHTAFTGDLHIAGDQFGNFPGAPWIHLKSVVFWGEEKNGKKQISGSWVILFFGW